MTSLKKCKRDGSNVNKIRKVILKLLTIMRSTREQYSDTKIGLVPRGIFKFVTYIVKA